MNTTQFTGKMAEKAPRFDQIIKAANYAATEKRAKSTLKPAKQIMPMGNIEDFLTKNN